MKSKLRILLIQQYLENHNEVGPIFPLGLSYIATAVKNEGFEVKVLDLNLFQLPYNKLRVVLKEYKFDIIGISLRNIDNVDKLNFVYFYEELNKTLITIKKNSSSSYIVIGGSGFSIFAQEIMERHIEINFGVYLEGEETIIELLNNLESPYVVKGLFYRINGCIRFTGVRQLPEFEKMPSPSREFFEMDKYSFPLCIGIQTKRGCLLHCNYCTYPHLNGENLRIRSPKSVVDEIEMLVRTEKVNEIIFTDSIFNIPSNHSEEIIKEILRRNIKIRWSAWFDIKNINQEFVDIAKKSGCYRMCFSPDGLVKETLNSLGKNLVEKDIEMLLDICRKNTEIDFRFSLFALPPDQTIRGLIKTILFVLKTHVFINNSRCLVSWIRILPNTDIYNRFAINKQLLLPGKLISHDHLFLENRIYSVVLVSIYTHVLSFVISLRRIRKCFWSN